MEKKSKTKQGLIINKPIRFSKIILFVIIFSLMSKTCHSKQITLFEVNDQVEFAKFIDFTIRFSELEDLKLTDFFLEHSFISVIANVTLGTECDKNSSPCNQPIRIYGKLNSIPRPENIYFDKKDDVGKLDGNSVIYGFEYSPCHLNRNDTLYLKVVGIEGKSNFSLKIKYNFMNKNKILCAGGLNIPPSKNFAAVNTPLGTIMYGGKINETLIDDQLYLLQGNNPDSLTWSSLIIDGNLSPKPRFGHYMAYFENHLIVFGGKTLDNIILNDLWVFNLDTMNWIEIEYSSSKNIPHPKFLAGGEVLSNLGLIVIFGGKESEEGNNLYFLNLKILFELADFKYFYEDPINKISLYVHDSKFDYPEKVNHLWKKVKVQDLVPRYGLTISQIGDHEILFFGGFERTDYASSRQEIYNIETNNLKVLQSGSSAELPAARGFHQILKFSSILFLHGGKSGLDQNLNDMWKFIISTQQWIKIKDQFVDEINFYMYNSEYFFTKLMRTERPVILGGYNKNQEVTQDIILLDFDLCLSDRQIFSEIACLPCSEGYELSPQGVCMGCGAGSYLDIHKEYYTQSTCKSCPAGSFNEYSNQQDMNGCKLCPFGSHNSYTGQKKCRVCKPDELCLPGSTTPIHHKDLQSKVQDDYLIDINYPNYIDSNHELKVISQNTAIMIVFAITGTMIIILIIAYNCCKTKMTKSFIGIDFIPLTGGTVKKCSGGVITILYSILILSLAFSFVLRYIYFNELIEVIPLGNTNNTQDSLNLSVLLQIDLVGKGFLCIEKEDKIDLDTYGCSTDISITKVNDPNYFVLNNKVLSCSQTAQGICRINFKCEDCKTIENNDQFKISIKNTESFVQLYNWSFNSVWADNFDYTKGHSILKGIFKPDSNIKSTYVFKGITPSIMQILLTPIFYRNKKENIMMSGYTANLKSFSKGSIRNELDFFKEGDGVNFDFQISYANNAYQVNSRKQIEILDFWAFLLGMVAGFSFLSRISKFICEKSNIYDYSMESYHEFPEETERPADISMNLDKNCSAANMNVFGHQISVELEISR